MIAAGAASPAASSAAVRSAAAAPMPERWIARPGAGQPRERAPLGGNGAHHRDHDRASVTRSRGLENASRMVLASYPQCIRQFAHRGSRSVP